MVDGNPEFDDNLRDERLADEDVRKIVSLVAEVALVDGPLHNKRKALLDGLCALVNGDCWLWAHSQYDHGNSQPVNLRCEQCGQFGDRQAVACALHVFDDCGASSDDSLPSKLSVRANCVTRTIADSVSFAHALGMDDFVYSVVPTEREGTRTYFSGVGLGRKFRRSRFTPRERKIAHIVISSVSWLHTDEIPTRGFDAAVELPMRLQCVLPMLIAGRSNAEIAEARNLSLDTVKKYASDLCEILGVQNRSELIAKFAVGDGGDLP